MADISKIKPNGTTYNIKDAVAREYNILPASGEEKIVGYLENGTVPIYRKRYVGAMNKSTAGSRDFFSVEISGVSYLLDCFGYVRRNIGNQMYQQTMGSMDFDINLNFNTSTGAWLKESNHTAEIIYLCNKNLNATNVTCDVCIDYIKTWGVTKLWLI